MTKYSKQEIDDAREMLLSYLQPGDTVYTSLEHVSKSGMSRVIQLHIFRPDKYAGDDPRNPTHFVLGWNAARVLGMSWDNTRDGIKVGGCGMDMGFHLVYSLAHALWPDGFDCIGERCPSNDHSNGDRDYSPHHHSDGGYALNQRWI